MPELRDAEVLHTYASQHGGLDGVWVPLAQGASLESGEALVNDWLAGWKNLQTFQGPALAVVETLDTKPIGQVGFRRRDGDAVELVYGVAPGYRGRGYASRAARLAARWLLEDGFAREVELRVGRGNVKSQRVAIAAGFTPAGFVRSHVEATGDTYDDFRFVMHGT